MASGAAPLEQLGPMHEPPSKAWVLLGERFGERAFARGFGNGGVAHGAEAAARLRKRRKAYRPGQAFGGIAERDEGPFIDGGAPGPAEQSGEPLVSEPAIHADPP